MLYLFITIIAGVISAIVYKASTEMGCRRTQHLLVERSILVVGFACMGSAFGGMALAVDVIVLSLVAGISIFVSRWALLKALSTGHAGVTFTFWNLGLVIPVLLSIFLWGEVPNTMQIIGLSLVPACLLLLREHDTRKASMEKNRSVWVVIYPALLCAGGEGVFSTCFKLMDVRGLDASRNVFLLLYNIVAVIAIVWATCSRGWSFPRKNEYLSGTAGGLALIIAGYFGLLAVLQVPGIVFFPVVAAGVLVLALLCTHLVWREKTSTAQRVGIVLSVVLIVFVSAA